MFQHFIAEEAFTHQLDCLFLGSEGPGFFTINRGDVLEVTKERKFLIKSGWYYVVITNNQHSFYIAYEDVQQYVLQGRLLSMLDIDLAVNCLEFQVNRSLDDEDKVSFLKHAEALVEAKAWKNKLEMYSCSKTIDSVM